MNQESRTIYDLILLTEPMLLNSFSKLDFSFKIGDSRVYAKFLTGLVEVFKGSMSKPEFRSCL